ncbi:MAE_28990/MAE_18760 family HEPN-like nuclease [Chryseobacterium sp. POE27]|uniref:MAE_28990/MAE_18760 family HEPN-like nuclease n=1 Tax=Chryseobacterium sp. POE27 TaxID=3138177 RepID=UPI0032194636
MNESTLEKTEEKKLFIEKSLLLNLYANFEGFFRFSMEIYAQALNESNIDLHKTINVLLVSCLHSEFSKYDDSNRWIIQTNEEIGKVNQRIINRQILLENINNTTRINKLQLPISTNHQDKNSIIHTESNLNPIVIDKILFNLGLHNKLGLASTEFNELMGRVSSFVKKRNGIAHGDNKNEYKNGLSSQKFEEYKTMYTKITELVAPLISKSLNEKLYLKPEYR